MCVVDLFSRARRVAAVGLNDALLLGEEQVYRPLEEAVVPALVKSSTFGNFVDDLSSLEVLWVYCVHVCGMLLVSRPVDNDIRSEAWKLAEIPPRSHFRVIFGGRHTDAL